MLYRSTCTILVIFYCFQKFLLVGEFLFNTNSYNTNNILFSAKGEEVPISFFPLSMTEWDRMTFLSPLDQGKTYMNSHNMIDIWEKLQLTISPLYGYIVHGEGRVQYQLYLPQLTINFCIYMFTSVLRSNKNVCYTTYFFS